MRTLTDANTEFAVELLKILCKNSKGENLFCSPLSISAALSMVLLGAKGDTAKQMEKVLCFTEIGESGSSKGVPVTGAQCDKSGGPHEQFKALLSAINQPTKDYALSIANRLYGSSSYEFLEQYLHSTKEMYHAELERVDFRNEEKVRKEINSWVESQTNGKIKDLFASGSISQDAILILVNAIYFKGKWKVKFNPKATHEAPFWTSKNQSKQVQMMFRKDEFNLAKIKSPALQILELPYYKEELSMFILLPDNKEAPDQLERELTSAKLKEWTSSANMKKQKMSVYIPKIKLEEKYELNTILEAMGMTDLFQQGKADLSGMSKNQDRNLVVSKVVHKAYVDVNEEGTEAAAGTGVGVVPTSAEILPEFKADRPFMFFIRHNETGSILFGGRCSSP